MLRIVVLAAMVAAAVGCSCVALSFDSLVSQQTDAFRVKIIKALPASDGKLYVGEVKRVFRGCEKKGNIVMIKTAGNSAACGVSGINKKGTWLIVSNRESDCCKDVIPVFDVNLCSGTSNWADVSKKNRKFLKTLDRACTSSCGGGENTCEYGGQTYNVGDSFPATDGCNTCKCGPNGLVACTRRACPATCTYNGQTYLVGERFDALDGCNTCTCSSDGSVACTEIGCKPPICKYNGQIYQVGDSFPATDGCNTCNCGSNGVVGCTKIACPPTTCTYNGMTYQPGDTFPAEDGCNSCSCSDNGFVACTLRFCPPPQPCGTNSALTDFSGRELFCGRGPNRVDCPTGSECVIDPADRFAVCCPTCGQNAEFTNCGTACPRTCRNYNQIFPCTLQCVVGCQCKSGYVLDDKGKCIKPANCPIYY